MGKRWTDPLELYECLLGQLGILWARWVCAFVNQAPMADVISAAMAAFPGDSVISGDRRPLEIHVRVHPRRAAGRVNLVLLKTLNVINPADLNTVATLQSVYCVQLNMSRPSQSRVKLKFFQRV